MPHLVCQVTGAEWEKNGPQTAAQRHFHHYVVDSVDGGGFNEGTGLQFYSKNAVFHNTNGSEYNGGVEIFEWMKTLFAKFERIKHDYDSVIEIQNDDGTAKIISQSTRHLWMLGNKTEKPSVSIPLTIIGIIGEKDDDAAEEVQWREVWLYWDTAPLKQFMEQKDVVFQRDNVIQKARG